MTLRCLKEIIKQVKNRTIRKTKRNQRKINNTVSYKLEIEKKGQERTKKDGRKGKMLENENKQKEDDKKWN